ncbi:response regulator [Variovorax sp. efr-133-TYG-130]|uniref:response regulator n=1 Tax=Variovorax sp. efr-133-TYG-130 TaxID=3040327 RepID=UPI0025535EA8|nr:response regulator [Variovorax sp. efr-133-TYG-130]
MPVTAFLVEDNQVIRDNLIPTIESLSAARVGGFAETEAEAMAWLEAHDAHWDVAVVDLFLREGSGLNVVDRCRARLPHQRVVIFSNYATEEVRRRALLLGADAVFDKSTEIDGLLDFLEQLNRL